ncbi:MAG: MBL fold metallo-hydrolase [Bacteroides sp.]|nr:MBL fold metallo-hydrolase [Bacteroides sp.]
MITVTYLDHSGFAVTTPEAVMVFDYYKDPNRKLEKVLKDNPSKKVVFFVSHHHLDHFNTSIFELAQDRNPTYVLANDIFSRLVPKKGISVAWMSAGDVIEQIPGTKQVKAYGSTDEGVSFAVTLPDGEVIFHAGDLNDWHWSEESTVREIEKAEAKFKTIVNRIAEDIPEVKIAMFPVDARMGADFAKGAEIFLEKVKVDNFFPMHFWGEPQKACDFASYVPEGLPTKCYCLDKPGFSVEIK